PLLLVIVSLAGLVVVPWVMQRRTAALQAEIIDFSSPARGLVTRIQYELAMEMAATRGLLLTGRESYVRAHEEARSARLSALSRLLALSAEVGPYAYERVLDLEKELGRADFLLDALYAGRISRSEYLARLPEQQSLVEDTLKHTAILDSVFSEEENVRRREANRITRSSVWAETGLVALASIAALFVALLGARQRALVRRLARHSRRETALKEAARKLGEAASAGEAAEVIAALAVSTTRADGAFVERTDLPSPDVEVVASFGHGTPLVGTRVPFPGSLSDEMIESGEPHVLSDDGAIGERLAPYLRETCPGCSCLVVPLSTKGTLLGALVMLRKATTESFSDGDVSAARSLGDLASAGLRRLMLVDELTESERRFRLVTDHLRQVIWLGSPDLTQRYFVNPACEAVFGTSREEFLSAPQAIVHRIHPDDRDRIVDAMGRLPERRFDERYRVERPDGQVRWIWSRVYPILREGGEAPLAAGIMEDITELKNGEEDRERLLESERAALAQSEEARAEEARGREELERVTRSRARLIRGFSHDLKNPLAAADGFLQLLERSKREPLTAGQRERVEKVRRSLHAALDLIENLLELARAEGGGLEIERAPVDLGEVVAEAAEEYRAQAEAAGLRLEATLPAEPVKVLSDRQRIRQVLSNFLSNAVKYTDTGRIIAGVTMTVAGRLGVFVADTGRGLSAEDRERIFQEFSRGESAAGREGVGIGLSISRAIASALRGEITVESEVGKGSTFTLWLPLDTEESGPPYAA
ncbi:MAG TPA: ATP-binding protein, partial [Vulgatibacter sp.]